MTHNLVCHPDTACPGIFVLSAEVGVIPNQGLQLRYLLKGDLQHLRVPATQLPAKADGLWEHTCFEAFIAVENNEGYQEFNFSPSGQWASYLFSAYRQRRDWQPGHAYAIKVEKCATDLSLEVVIPTGELPLITDSKTIQVGLTAVLEATDGSRSYWALCHPANVPDFHHRGGFIYSLAPHILPAQ